MIQYQYFHTGKEYISILSLNRNDERFKYNEKIFEAIRTGIRGEAFTYALLSDEFIMMQFSSSQERGSFAKGLRGNISSITNNPAKYVDQFEKSVSESDKNLAILPDGKFPVLGRLLDSFSVAERLHHIFPKLFDALVYGEENKQVVIIADSHESAINYIKVISMLLPLSFIKKIGFCIGCTSIPDEPISIVNADGNIEKLGIRIWVPELSNFNFDAYSNSYYIFDTVSNRDNYDKVLSNAAKTLDEINLCNDTQSRNFANCIAKAFSSNGDVRFEELDKLASIYLFNIKRDSNSARAVLSLGSEGSVEQENAVIDAIQFILNESRSGKQPPAQERENIVLEYRQNNRLAHAISDSLYEYCVSFYRNLNTEEKNIFSQLISADNTGGRLNSFLQSSLRGDFKAMVEAFTVSGIVLEEQMRTIGYNIQANHEFTKTIIQFFDISGCHQRIPMNQRFEGEEFFREIQKNCNIEMQKILSAILMASAYFSGVPVECCEIRIKGLKKLLQQSSMTKLSQLEFILGVRNRLLEIADEIYELGIEEDFDFIFNCEAGKLWMRELLGDLSLSDTLKADYFVRSHSAERRFYESMQEAVREKLLDINYVRRNIKSGTTERDKYIEFFRTLSREQREEYNEIDEYLNELDHEAEINEEFANYRYDFAMECYATFQESDKKKVKKDSSVLSYKETPANERLDIVEKTINTFGTVTRIKRKPKKFFSSIGIWAFFLGLLSLAILTVPAIVIPASLGTFDWTHVYGKFLSYFIPEFFSIPLLIYFFDYAMYLCLKKGNRIKRANIITIIFGVLPVVLFICSYILFYFVRLPLPFVQ